ncbi:MAG: AAA family ATPase [Gammaproteobacteria bacterium]|nr:AAA family ATPase [Gammaproteobacteria bacterium]
MTKIHFALTGEAATGKTTVGRLLANKLGLPFKDLDTEIGVLPDDRAFRVQESKSLSYLLSDPEPQVIATGGGCVMFVDNRDNLAKHSVVIHLLAADWIKERNLKADASRTMRHQYSVHNENVRHWVKEECSVLINVLSTNNPDKVCSHIIDILEQKGLV